MRNIVAGKASSFAKEVQVRVTSQVEDTLIELVVMLCYVTYFVG
jgi:hypothetical protein